MNDRYAQGGNKSGDIARLREEVFREAHRDNSGAKDSHETQRNWDAPERMEELGRGAMNASRDTEAGTKVYGIYDHDPGASMQTFGEARPGQYGGLNPEIIASSEQAPGNQKWENTGNSAIFETILPEEGQSKRPKRYAKRNLGGELSEVDMETVLSAVQTTDDKGLNKAGYEMIRRLEKKLDETGDVASFFEGCRDLMAKNLRNSYANRRDFLKNMDKIA